MGIFNFFKTKKARIEAKEEETQKTVITKLKKNIYNQRINYLKDKLEHLKQRHEELILEDQINDLEEDLNGKDEEENENPLNNINPEDTMFNNLISLGVSAMNNRQNVVSKPPPTQTTLSPNVKKIYTDDEISLIIANTPKETLQQIKGLPDAMLKNIINNKYPDADDISIQKTIQIIRNQ